MVIKTIRPGEKFESYARDIMAELIKRRPWPQRNELINWDLEHVCTFDGNPIECKWHRSRWQGNRQTSQSYDSVIAKNGSIASSPSLGKMKSSGVPNPKYKLLLFDKLGSGSYGLVCRAISDDESRAEDIRQCKDRETEHDRRCSEGARCDDQVVRHHTQHVLRPPGHRNVLAILGYVVLSAKRENLT